MSTEEDYCGLETYTAVGEDDLPTNGYTPTHKTTDPEVVALAVELGRRLPYWSTRDENGAMHISRIAIVILESGWLRDFYHKSYNEGVMDEQNLIDG